MEDKLVEFANLLRQNGVRVSLAETLDALAASGMVGLGERDAFRGALRATMIKRASELFARGNKAPAADGAQKVIDDLHRKIGQLQVERDFLAGQPAISRLLRGGR